MFSKTFLLVFIIVAFAIVASEGRRQGRNLFTRRSTRFLPRRRLITWKKVGKVMKKANKIYKKVSDHETIDLFLDEEDERDHSVGRSWKEKWDFVERCMAGKPRMYNSWKTWARECDDRSKNSAFYDEEEDENVGSDALGCYLFPQAPKCRQWDMFNADDDVGFTDLPRRSLGQVSAKCYFTQQKLCGQCGGDNNCRMACNRRNAGRLARACGYRRQLRSIPSWTRA